MAAFEGFSPETVSFYEDLAQNNAKEWFEAHKDTYKESVLGPAQDFLLAMGDRLRILSPAIIADTRLNGAGSIFRIYRDTRFSSDKSPYKPHLGILLWEGTRKKTECSGYYMHLEPPNLMLGVGVYMFTKPLLKIYRDAVVHPEYSLTLREAVEGVREMEQYNIGGEHYKRVPRGYDADHRNAEYLRYNGLHVGSQIAIPDDFYSGAFIEYCFERFRDMAPIHHWLVSILNQT